jgi:hypothetical protein
MDDTLENEQVLTIQDKQQTHLAENEVSQLHADYQSRLVAANLRTEAVRAGMIDLDGLKLIDLSSVVLDASDKVVGGRKLMEDLRRDKPWLFGTASSSSAAVAPASQPVRTSSKEDCAGDDR